MGVKSEIIPENDSRDFNEEKYWEQMKKLITRYNPNKNVLLEMMHIQNKNNDRHAVDYRKIN